jgi:hypothetical protein
MTINLLEGLDAPEKEPKSSSPEKPKKSTQESSSKPSAPAASRAPKPEAIVQKKPEGVWVISFDFDGKQVKDFPLAWLLHHYTPYVYLNVLKYNGIVGQEATYKSITEGGPASILSNFQNALINAVYEQHPHLDEVVRPYFAQFFQDIVSLAQEEAGNEKLLDVLYRECALAMSAAQGKPNVEKTILDKVMKDHGFKDIADPKTYTVNAKQRANIQSNAASISYTISGVLDWYKIPY